jgi:hypothetical protein
MKLIYRVPTLDEALDTTLWTQEDGQTPYWRDWLYRVYPELEKEKILALPWLEREKVLKKELTKIYNRILPQLTVQAKHWNQIFQSHQIELTQAFSSAFQVDATSILNDMFACPNINPISPRYLDKHSFYMFYRMSDEVMFRTSLHEIIHFFWFYKWHEFFHDLPAEYDTPHLKWIYSEMVTDTFARFSELKAFFGDERTAYDYFYTLDLNGENILITLGKIYQAKGIVGLFGQGFDYLQKHEARIRHHIQICETTL